MREHLRLDPRSVGMRLKLAEMLLARGCYAEALSQMERAVRSSPDSAEARAALGQMWFWRGQYSRARAEAGAGLRLQADHPGARRLGAALKILRGPTRLGLSEMREYLARFPADSEARLWLGEAYLRLGRARRAHREIEAAIRLRRESLPAHLLRALCLLELGDPLWKSEWEDFLFDPGSRRIPWRPPQDPSPARAKAALWEMLRLLAGNRSTPATFARRRAGRPRLVTADRPSPGMFPKVRIMGHSVQSLLREGDVERVLREFDPMLRDSLKPPALSLALCYRGEVFLWAGRLAEAMEDFRRARSLCERTTWGYIGPCGVYTLQGLTELALREAETALSLGGIGVWTWKGEAYRRAGDLRAAVDALQRGLAILPRQLATMVSLALSQGALGEAASQKELFVEILKQAPSLVSDAWRLIGGPGASPGVPSSERLQALLAQCLELLRGNRSSWLDVYFLPGGELRRFGGGCDPYPRFVVDSSVSKVLHSPGSLG